jgi:hypothetical protein
MADLQAIAERYRKTLLGPTEAYRLAPAELPSLAAAISSAARCTTPDGRRHNHQRRIPKVALQEAERRLLATEDALGSAGGFEPLYAILANELRDVRNIGPVTKYDITTGIGAYLGWQPGRVYLHAGAAEGARAIGVKAADGHSAPLEAFPIELRGLGPYHLENLLCIFKHELGGKPLSAETPDGCELSLEPDCVPPKRRMRRGGGVC